MLFVVVRVRIVYADKRPVNYIHVFCNLGISCCSMCEDSHRRSCFCANCLWFVFPGVLFIKVCAYRVRVAPPLVLRWWTCAAFSHGNKSGERRTRSGGKRIRIAVILQSSVAARFIFSVFLCYKRNVVTEPFSMRCWQTDFITKDYTLFTRLKSLLLQNSL